MDGLIRAIAEKGDLAHVALLLWALGASAAFFRAFSEVARASRRFDEFVRELARFNARHAPPGEADRSPPHVAARPKGKDGAA